MIVISLGIDCSPAIFLARKNLRPFSLPFDWTVTYKGVTEILRSDFNDFMPINSNRRNQDGSVLFLHDSFPDDVTKYTRRISRLKNILEISTEEIIFFRKGHVAYHHKECPELKNDIQDAEDLNIFLKDKYPNLNYSIIVSLLCDKCFDPSTNYANSDRIQIHNIDTPAWDENKFKSLINLIF